MVKDIFDAMTDSKPPNPQKSWLWDSWVVELTGAILSILSLIAIVLLLLVYDGKSTFTWHGVTLNTIVSILATTARTSIVLVVSSSLAQQKWMWLSRHPRPLMDFETFDAASRGPSGSIKLLWSTKSWAVAAVGAWVIVLAAAVDPFVQQLLTYDSDLIFSNDSTSAVPYASRYSQGTMLATQPDYGASDTTVFVDSYYTVSGISLPFSMQASASFGLTTDSNDIAQQLPTTCGSGNCNWPPFISLALCSTCNDVSGQVTKERILDWPMEWSYPGEDYNHDSDPNDQPLNLTNYLLPNGANINNADVDLAPVIFTAKATQKPSETVSFRDSSTLLFAISMLNATRTANNTSPIGVYENWSNTAITATECGLYFCAKEYASQIVNGTVIETSTELESGRALGSFAVDIVMGSIDQEYTPKYGNGVTGDVDALFQNTTFLPRTDLMIKVPQTKATELVNGTSELTAVNVSQVAIGALSSFVSNIFNDGSIGNATAPPGPCSVDSAGIPSTACGQLTNITGMIKQQPQPSPIQYSPAIMDVLFTSSDLGTTFANMAASITNNMRANSDGTLTLSGQRGRYETLLRVRWPWIILPAVLIFAGAFFLLISMLEARRDAVPLWKSSALATLMHGLDSDLRDNLKKVTLLSHMEREAEHVKVQLLGSDHTGPDTLFQHHESADTKAIMQNHVSPPAIKPKQHLERVATV